jgi:hypothetical protein
MAPHPVQVWLDQFDGDPADGVVRALCEVASAPIPKEVFLWETFRMATCALVNFFNEELQGRVYVDVMNILLDIMPACVAAPKPVASCAIILAREFGMKFTNPGAPLQIEFHVQVAEFLVCEDELLDDPCEVFQHAMFYYLAHKDSVALHHPHTFLRVILTAVRRHHDDFIVQVGATHASHTCYMYPYTAHGCDGSQWHGSQTRLAN